MPHEAGLSNAKPFPLTNAPLPGRGCLPHPGRVSCTRGKSLRALRLRGSGGPGSGYLSPIHP